MGNILNYKSLIIMLIELFLTHLEEAVAGNIQQVEEELYQMHNLLEEVEHCNRQSNLLD